MGGSSGAYVGERPDLLGDWLQVSSTMWERKAR
jgi:hypothetical protein